MLTAAYYCLQVIICSAILMVYYWLVLRNKRFHQYNRFYLLGVGIFSWMIPLLKIKIYKPTDIATPQLLHLANIVASNNSEIDTIVQNEASTFNWNSIFITVYISVSVVFLVMLVVGLVKVLHLLKKYPCKTLGDVYLVMTNQVAGTPFSFFKYIFWNDSIDINTVTGTQMMQHELTHVREKHSIDKLIMQLVMVFGWFNPVFWLTKRELHLVHEFIADNKAIKDGDASALAAMLLTATYPNQQYLLSNAFFFSPIKRRILMLTKTNKTSLSYARRVVVLPLLAIVVMLFAFRKSVSEKPVLPLDKTYTVVIDAGHGGKDAGATAADGTKEKDLALLFLKAIKAANKNDKIKLVFTREEDVYQSPVEKASFVNEQKADLFVSLHINSASNADDTKSGIEIFVPKNDVKRANINQCISFATAIQNSLKQSYSVAELQTRQTGIWILGATSCPATLIECGYLSNTKDLAMLKSEAERNKMAELILKGINDFLYQKQSDNTTAKSIEHIEDGLDYKNTILKNIDSYFLLNQSIPKKYYLSDAILTDLNSRRNDLLKEKKSVRQQNTLTFLNDKIKARVIELLNGRPILFMESTK